MAENQARRPGDTARRWQSIRSVEAQERQDKMRQKAREQGISDEKIEADYVLATEEAARTIYEYPTPSGAPLTPAINAGGPEQWATARQRAQKPWSPEYLEYFMQRALLDGEGRGTATTEDGHIISLRYERRVEEPAKAADETAEEPRKIQNKGCNKRTRTLVLLDAAEDDNQEDHHDDDPPHDARQTKQRTN